MINLLNYQLLLINVHIERETAPYDRFCTYVTNEELTAPYDTFIKLSVYYRQMYILNEKQHHMIDFVHV